MDRENIHDHRRKNRGVWGALAPTFHRDYLVIWPLGRLTPLPR